MDKNQLLALDKLSGSTLQQVRTQNQELFKQLQDRVTAERRNAILASFAGTSAELRGHLEKLDYSPDPEGKRDVRQVILGSLQAQRVKSEVAREAIDRLVELDRSNLLVDPAATDVPIKDHPLFQQDLQQAALYKLAGVAQLADQKTDRIVGRTGAIAAIDDGALQGLVKERALDDVEAKRLGLTTSVYHLTDGQLELADALVKGEFPSVPGGRLDDVRDLVALTQADWLRTIERARVQPPDGLDAKSYAARLSANVASLFPTEALLARVIPRNAQEMKEVTAAVSGVGPLLDRNPDAFSRSFDDLDTAGLNQQELPALRAAHARLQRLANVHPGLRLDEVLSDKRPAAEKARVVASRLAILGNVVKQNPDVEFLTLDYSPDSPDVASLKLDGISADEQRMALADFKTYQRAFALTNDVDHAQAVLGAGYHSAIAVASGRYEAFQQATGLSEAVALEYYRAARTTVATITTTVVSIADILKGGFDFLGVSNAGPSIQDYLRKVDGFADLFGNQDCCRCEHCQSILSPAAYFVDLMSFVEEHVLNVYFAGAKSNHVLNLKVRRPDLWTLPLTCKNTDERVPYLDIINEILENYVARRRGFGGDLNDRAAVEEAVYHQAIAVAVDSFRQPFVLPLEKLHAYLAHFDRTRAFVARALGAPASTVTPAALELSRREYDLITQPNTGLAFLRNVYGIQFNVPASGVVDPFDAQLMLKYTGLSRDDLGQLVETRFVKAGGAQPVQIRSEKASPASVQNDVERIHNLTTDSLDRLHRFTRLWRQTRWTIPELDLVLTHLAKAGLATGIGTAALDGIVAILGLAERWTLPVEQSCALWSDVPRIDLAGKGSLFDRLFNLRPFVLADGPLPKDAVKFVHPSFRQSGVPSPADNTLSRLLAGLQVSADDLAHLIAQLATPLGVNLGTANEDDRGFLLTVGNLTLLYRHARLAQLLKLSIPDLFQLIRHAGLAGRHVASLADLTALLDFHDWWKSSGFKLDALGFITRGLVQRPSDYPGKLAMANGLVADLTADKALQFADTVFAFLPGVTEDQSRGVIAANAAAFQAAPDGAGLRLTPAFDPTAPLTVPAGATAAEPDLRAVLLKYHASQVLPARLAARLGLSADKVAALVALTGVSLSAAGLVQALQGGAVNPLADLLDRLLPLAILLKNDVFDPAALGFIRTHAAIFGVADFGNVGMDAVRKLSVYVAFGDTSKQADFTPTLPPIDPQAVQQVLAAFDPVQKFAGADASALAGILRTDAGLVSTLLPSVTLPATAPEALAKLGACVDLAQYLGVGGETLKLVVSDDYADLARASQAILSAFRAKYLDEQEFQDKLEPFEDAIRSRRRDALAEYLVRSIHPEFDSRNELYEYFLVDVQLEGCARTSRLVAAISSVQLYVHRCLMNLEQDRRDPTDPNHTQVRPDSIPLDEWAWRKNYRVWEANRKVFLYPENYIEPELRDDKTPLFKELESTLLQQQIDEQNVLDAYATYLSGFEEVARLKLAGAYHDRDASAKTDVLHLFGVTTGDPPVYYYRTVENAYYGEVEAHRAVVYSPWRKIDVQIPVRKIAPVVYLGRLFVFWVEITSTAKNEVTKDGSQFVGYKHRLLLKYTTLRLDGSWTPPQAISLSDPTLFSTGDGIVDDPLAEKAEKDEFGAAMGRFDFSAAMTAYQKMLTPRYDTRLHLEPIDGYTLTGFQWDQVYPERKWWGALNLTGRNFAMRADVDFYRKIIVPRTQLFSHSSGIDQVLCSRFDGGTRRLYYGVQPWFLLESYAQCSIVSDQRRLDALGKTGEPRWLASLLSVGLYNRAIATLSASDEIAVINGSLADAVVDSNGDLLLLQGSVRPGPDYLLKRLGTTLGERMSRKLFTAGVDGLLDIANQKTLREAALPIGLIANVQNAGNAGKLDFRGSFGTYYREIFFHVPFLIANHLNSQQRFAAAQRWYHYIFNPTATETILVPPGLPPAERARRQRDRVWRYLEFRGLDVPKLRDVLTDPAAIEVYKKDPFNPHAIARLRLSAYQKSVVMKYIDNLLDWGDSLFSQFTMESVNEATMLYVLAADILGPRPAELGSCGEGAVSPRTYEKIGPLVKKGSDFLVELETWVWVKSGPALSRGKKKLSPIYALDQPTIHFYAQAATRMVRPQLAASAAGPAVGAVATAAASALEGPVARANGAAARAEATVAAAAAVVPVEEGIARAYDWKGTQIGAWTSVKDRPVKVIDHISPLIRDYDRIPAFGWSLIRQLSPVFCIPENKDLREYWDRVDDRLYKIRHCLDITGARRELALFAPEIDPRLLVRARAAGLSIEEVLNATSGNLPPYRFAYLIEKARQHTSAVQAFGAALLSALEKRDMEELNRLRTVQQQNLLKLTTRVREWEITIAADAVATLERQQAAVQYRRDYYQGLLDTDLIPTERIQEIARHTASTLSAIDSAMNVVAGVGYLVPQLGSPFAMKWGGVEIGNSATAWARVTRGLVGVAEAVAASTGLEAGFERRREGWQHQVDLADHELKQIDKQLAAAQLRQEIATRSLDIHKKTIEQIEEIYEFYNTRFTKLGLYTWLSTTLQRTYREAYNGAYAMARLAEQAYRFERGDDTTSLLQSDYWDASNAGLLAGERLLVDLQNLERRFVETNYRSLEIDQAFSLTQVNPAALIQLREAGACDFEIPEVFFDLFYPGQYRRRIKSVRLTIPCVTGPYTNVSATLTLTGSKLRNEPRLGAASLLDVPPRRSVSVATSTAQNDSGVFEFSFRDERYMPFEGAGAISAWKLSLPKSFRPFDYQTINDVVVHVSYTAEEDGLFRDRVEQLNAAVEGTILNYLSSNSLARVFSLRQDFSSALNRLLHSAADTAVSIQITDKYLPIFLRGRNVQVTRAKLALKTPDGQTVNGFRIAVDGAEQAGFARDPQMGNLWSKDLGALFAGGIVGQHTLAVKNAGDLAPAALPPGDASAVDSDKLLDVMLYVEYRVA